MKGQIEKIETRSDNVIKLSITIQPEHCPSDIMRLRFQMVEILEEDTYNKLSGGHQIAVPARFIEGLKTLRSVVDDMIADSEVKSEEGMPY